MKTLHARICVPKFTFWTKKKKKKLQMLPKWVIPPTHYWLLQVHISMCSCFTFFLSQQKAHAENSLHLVKSQLPKLTIHKATPTALPGSTTTILHTTRT